MKNLSLILKVGFYASMCLLFAGFIQTRLNLHFVNLSDTGMLFLLFLPLFLVFCIAVYFIYNKDYKKSIIAAVLFTVLIINIFL